MAQGLFAEGRALQGAELEDLIVSIAGVTVLPHVSRKRDHWLYELATLAEMRSRTFGRRLVGHSHPDDPTDHSIHDEKSGFAMQSAIYSKPIG